MKQIKKTTLENRFNKLHTAIALTEDCINASIAFLKNAMYQETDTQKSTALSEESLYRVLPLNNGAERCRDLTPQALSRLDLS